VDLAAHGEEVLVVCEDVGACEDDHLIPAPVQLTSVKGLDEAQDNGAVRHPLQLVHGVCA
jgi:hypothetical protein